MGSISGPKHGFDSSAKVDIFDLHFGIVTVLSAFVFSFFLTLFKFITLGHFFNCNGFNWAQSPSLLLELTDVFFFLFTIQVLADFCVETVLTDEIKFEVDPLLTMICL